MIPSATLQQRHTGKRNIKRRLESSSGRIHPTLGLTMPPFLEQRVCLFPNIVGSAVPRICLLANHYSILLFVYHQWFASLWARIFFYFVARQDLGIACLTSGCLFLVYFCLFGRQDASIPRDYKSVKGVDQSRDRCSKARKYLFSRIVLSLLSSCAPVSRLSIFLSVSSLLVFIFINCMETERNMTN